MQVLQCQSRSRRVPIRDFRIFLLTGVTGDALQCFNFAGQRGQLLAVLHLGQLALGEEEADASSNVGANVTTLLSWV